MLRVIAVSFAAVLAMSAAQAAKMYKWVDENGVTHFSTRPPPRPNADDTKLEGGSVMRKRPSAESSDLAKIEAVDLRGHNWDGCTSSLCQLVRELDPSCETSYCSRAKSMSGNCASASCQAKKVALESEVRDRLADREALRQQQAINADKTPTPP